MAISKRNRRETTRSKRSSRRPQPLNNDAVATRIMSSEQPKEDRVPDACDVRLPDATKAVVCSPAFFAPRRMIHRSGRYGFAHGPTTAAAYGFGIIDIAPGGAKPVAYADASCILLYVLRGNATVTLGENQFSAVVGRGDAFVVYAGNWFGVRNNSHATFATAVYIHARKAAAAADAGPRRSSSSSSSSNTKLAPTMAAAPADDLAARAAVEQDTRLATTTTTARPVAHDASAPSVVSYSHLGDPPRWLAPHGDEFVRAGDYAAILGYDLCGESPAALRCPAEWSKQRRPGRPKDAVNHGSKSTKPLQAIFAVHHSSVGSESQEAVEKDAIYLIAYFQSQLNRHTSNGVSVVFVQAQPWLSWGLIMLPPGGAKPRQSSDTHHYICYLVAGQLLVSYGDNDAAPQTNVCVKEGSFWEIPCVNGYGLTNTSRTQFALLLFLRINQA